MMSAKLSLACQLLFVIGSALLIPAKDDNLSESLHTHLIQEWEDPLLLLSTLDGSFIGVGQRTGFIRWKLKDEPIVKVPVDTSKAIVPLFLPDPKDGSLYVLGSSDRDALKKLPFTIPQLVASSPCRSSDGILYTGKKVDTWFSVDPKTGAKQEILSFAKVDETCPILSSDAIFIGRTEYNIMMLDSKHKERRWNVTFFDYSSTTMEAETFQRYELVHFTASSSGRVLSLDRRKGSLLWEHDYDSPVIAVYVLESEGLVAVPFTSVAEETLNHLSEQFSSASEPMITTDDMKLYPTLYVGEHRHGLYALPSLVDENTVTITTTQSGPLLLEGPPQDMPLTAGNQQYPQTSRIPLPGHNIKMSPNYVNLPITFQSLPKGDHDSTQPALILGHYKVPDYSKTLLQISGKSHKILINTPESLVILDNKTNSDSSKHKSGRVFTVVGPDNREKHISVGMQTDPVEEEKSTGYWEKLGEGNMTFILSKDFVNFSFVMAKSWLSHQEHKTFKLMFVVIVGCIFSMLWYLYAQVRVFQQLSQGSRGSRSDSSGRYYSVTAQAEDMGGGIIRVGKITFDMDNILGKGCEGTFVYKGEFDNRAIAVKRILPECFTFADREVELLRESDEHPNVVRYFCTEQDKQFRYIALELCAATLQDYIEGRFDRSKIDTYDILYQSTMGLEHLHALDIVHRDIKPHNVLLSMSNSRGEVRAMISDFGLCKKLKLGRMSFSRRSGVTGTDGWIAPEMLTGDTRTTCSVDIFSLGCVFYYVLTSGKHPFGDSLRRQANILNGEFRLSELEGEEFVLPRSLVQLMISTEAVARPPASAIHNHPIFWNKARILAFFQDVSDRVEKDDECSPVLQALERGSGSVVREDWRNHIDTEVAQDLRRYRNYRGTSIRDLLRALRNKKHHYRELSEEAQKSLGQIPNKFVDYWTCRFPLLLLHTWLAMQCVKHEPIFCQYYHAGYSFNNCLNAIDNDFNDYKSSFLSLNNAGNWIRRKSSPRKSKVPNALNKGHDGTPATLSSEMYLQQKREQSFSPYLRRRNMRDVENQRSEVSENWRRDTVPENQSSELSMKWRRDITPVRELIRQQVHVGNSSNHQGLLPDQTWKVSQMSAEVNKSVIQENERPGPTNQANESLLEERYSTIDQTVVEENFSNVLQKALFISKVEDDITSQVTHEGLRSSSKPMSIVDNSEGGSNLDSMWGRRDHKTRSRGKRQHPKVRAKEVSLEWTMPTQPPD